MELMSINLQDLLTAVGGVTGISFAVAFLMKSVINHALTRDAEKFKAQLKADADLEIEKLRSSLQMVAIEHQVRFSSLHAERAKIIAELHGRLVDAERSVYRFVMVEAYREDAEPTIRIPGNAAATCRPLLLRGKDSDLSVRARLRIIDDLCRRRQKERHRYQHLCAYRPALEPGTPQGESENCDGGIRGISGEDSGGQSSLGKRVSSDPRSGVVGACGCFHHARVLVPQVRVGF